MTNQLPPDNLGGGLTEDVHLLLLSGLKDRSTEDILKDMEKARKELKGEERDGFLRIAEVELEERKRAAAEEHFDAAPAGYTTQESDEESRAGSMSTPVRIGLAVAGIAIVSIGYATYSSSNHTPDSTTQSLTDTVASSSGAPSTEKSRVDYGKAGAYLAYSANLPMTYEAGTNTAATSVAWHICDASGAPKSVIALHQATNVGAALMGRRWKSSGAKALPPGDYVVTIVAEFSDNQTDHYSFLFNPESGMGGLSKTECQ